MSDNAPQGLKPETVLLHGPAAEEIARRVHGVVDLLLVGSRGYGPLRRALLGSVSGALVRDAGGPVIIIPRTEVGPRRAPEAAAAAHASGSMVSTATHETRGARSRKHLDQSVPSTLTTGERE